MPTSTHGQRTAPSTEEQSSATIPKSQAQHAEDLPQAAHEANAQATAGFMDDSGKALGTEQVLEGKPYYSARVAVNAEHQQVAPAGPEKGEAIEEARAQPAITVKDDADQHTWTANCSQQEQSSATIPRSQAQHAEDLSQAAHEANAQATASFMDDSGKALGTEKVLEGKPYYPTRVAVNLEHQQVPPAGPEEGEAIEEARAQPAIAVKDDAKHTLTANCSQQEQSSAMIPRP